MEINGKVIAVLPVQSGVSKSGNAWQSQSFVVEETEGEYPQSLCLDLFGNKIQEADVKVGDIVTVQFNVSCKQFGAKWYNSIKAWRVSKQGGSNNNTKSNNNVQHEAPSAPSVDSSNLPF